MKPLVSVVIPAYNAMDHVDECLASIYAQQNHFPLEIIVADDGSTDQTLEKLRSNDNLICLTQTNRGPAAARNLGIRYARGDYIAFLDADDLWPEGKLRKQIELLEQHPEAAMCFGDCQQFEGDHWWPRTLFEEGRFGEKSWGNDPFVPNAYASLLENNFITTGSVVVRRHVLEKLGGFDENLRLVEDLELWLRIALHYPIIWCKDVCLLRRRHSCNTSREPDAMSLAYLNVLERQRNCCKDELARLGVDLKVLFAREYRIMAGRALDAKKPNDAAHWAWQGFMSRPALWPLWQLMQAMGQKLGRHT